MMNETHLSHFQRRKHNPANGGKWASVELMAIPHDWRDRPILDVGHAVRARREFVENMPVSTRGARGGLGAIGNVSLRWWMQHRHTPRAHKEDVTITPATGAVAAAANSNHGGVKCRYDAKAIAKYPRAPK